MITKLSRVCSPYKRRRSILRGTIHDYTLTLNGVWVSCPFYLYSANQNARDHKDISLLALFFSHRKLNRPFIVMEDTLTSLWENLSLTEIENATINIDYTKLLAPSNALIGRLAMKKHVTTFDLEKGLRSMWEVPASMEVTLLNEYLFMFELKDARACDRIFEKQPWNYRGSLLILD